ncbi:hypothetical protein BOX15_Mlig006959g1, partial [Macrostomum lignano]
ANTSQWQKEAPTPKRQPAHVSFYAWFLQPSSASQLVQLAQAFVNSVALTTGLDRNANLTPSSSTLLHITAKYCGKCGAQSYTERSEVAASIGRSFDIRLTGLLLRPGSSLVARAELSPSQLALWDNEPTKSEMPSGKSLPRGSRAHVTLATAPGVRPSQAGFDLLDALAILQSSSSASPSSVPGGGHISWLSGGRVYLTLAKPLTVAAVFDAHS